MGEGGVLDWLPVHHRADTSRQTTFTPTGDLESPIRLNHTSVACERKPEGTHADSRRTRKLHTGRPWTGNQNSQTLQVHSAWGSEAAPERHRATAMLHCRQGMLQIGFEHLGADFSCALGSVMVHLPLLSFCVIFMDNCSSLSLISNMSTNPETVQVLDVFCLQYLIQLLKALIVEWVELFELFLVGFVYCKQRNGCKCCQ